MADIKERMGNPEMKGTEEFKFDPSKMQSGGMRMGPPGRGPGPNHGAPGEKPKNVGKTVSRLIRYIGKNKFLVFALIGIMIAVTLLELLGPSLQGFAINEIYYIVRGETDSFSGLIGYLAMLLGVYVITALFTWIQSLICAKVSQSTVYTLRKDLFKKISKLPISYTDTHAHGDLMSRMTNDVDNVSNTISSTLASLISSIMTLIGSMIMIIWYSRNCLVMAIVAVCTIPLTLFVSMKLSQHMSKYFVQRQKVLGSLNGQVEETVTGFKTIMAYGRQNAEVEEFNDDSEKLRVAGVKSTFWSGIMGPVNNFISNLNYVLVAAVGGYFVLQSILTGNVILLPGTLQSIISYSKQFSFPISRVAEQYSQILTAVAGAERVFEVLDTPDEIDEGKESLSEVRGNIEFKNIDFSYVPNKQVLYDFNLSVKPGQKIAIVGATGSGKTTVVNLLTRFYDVNSGSIILDGIDIRDIPKEELRRDIAIVLQDTVLFGDTISTNIRYGKTDATDDEIEEAAKTANAHSFIKRLNGGYESVLSEGGSNLSQGQRQLISIARAVLANPKILILDEATSSVDTRTEMKIQNAMLSLMKGRTSLIIAHRLSTIRDADKIVVISDGHVVEEGNHDELLARGGEYFKLYQNQFAGIAT